MKLAVFLSAWMLLASELALANAPREWRFRVLLDGSEVGSHVFRVTERDRDRLVESDARMRVRLLFLDAYTYEHQARERWQGDCLGQLRAETNDNGKRVSVRGMREGAQFEVNSSAGGVTRLDACVMSFAYWNPAILQQRQLLNPQTGLATEIRVEPLGEEVLNLRGTSVRSQRFALHAPDMRIDLWYTPDNRWVQLESRVKSGRVLRYEIQ